jgi:DNA-binding protein YbaB
MSIELRKKPTTEEIEQMCIAAEEAARKVLFTKISLKQVSDLDVMVEAIGDKPLVLSIDVGIELLMDDENLQALVNAATDAAFSAAEGKAQELNLCVDTRS